MFGYHDETLSLVFDILLLKLISISSRSNIRNQDHEGLRISDRNQQRLSQLIFLFSSIFDGEDNIQDLSILTTFQIPGGLSEILPRMFYFQLCSQCLEM